MGGDLRMMVDDQVTMEDDLVIIEDDLEFVGGARMLRKTRQVTVRIKIRWGMFCTDHVVVLLQYLFTHFISICLQSDKSKYKTMII